MPQSLLQSHMPLNNLDSLYRIFQYFNVIFLIFVIFEIKDNSNFLLLDLREPEDFELFHIAEGLIIYIYHLIFIVNF